MASPFRIFRKYMKTLLVIFGVMIMFVFVVGDSLVAYLGGGRNGGGRSSSQQAGDVAVKWNGGSLTNQEVYNLVQRRRIVNFFIQGVEFTGREAAFRAGVEPRPLRVDPIYGAETPQQGVEGNVVQTKLFADAAREAGMRVSDEAIVAYLDELGRQNVSREQMRDLLNRLPGNMRVSIQFVIDALRDEMLARNYVASHAYAFETVTPHQRYRDWLNVNDRIVIEAAPIAVEPFTIDVPEPTEADLAKFFDDHKNREPQPDFIGQTEYPSPTPGFRIPRRIDVQYIQAEYEPFLAKVENEITDDEIAKYYEENKELFVKAGLTEDTPAEAPADDAATGTESTDDRPPGTEAQPQAPESSSTDEPAANSTVPAGEPPSEEGQSPQDASDPDTQPADGDQSSSSGVLPGSIFRLAAFLQQNASDDAAAAGGVDETPAPADEPPPAQAPAAETAAPEAETPVTTESNEAAASEAPSTEGESAASSDAPASAATSPPKEYQSLDEVRDLIRRDLARRKVNEQLSQLMNELQTEVNGEFTRYFSVQLDAEAKQQKPPAPPQALTNLAPLAEKHGLKHGKTGPMSVLELRSTPVGASGDLERQSELFRLLFGSDDLELFEPVSTQDIDGNRFLAMKVSDTPGRVPELAEVRKEVVAAWKRNKAADKAQTHADDLAKKAQDSKSPLANFFADKSIEVVRSDPFARYTGGEIGVVGGEFQQEPFRLSEPDGVVAAGPEFMDKVFELKEGEVAAVLNHDKSIAYVVRIAEHQMREDELRTAFLSEANTWPGANIMARSHAQTVARLLVGDILASKELKWERTPDDMTQDDEEEAAVE